MKSSSIKRAFLIEKHKIVLLLLKYVLSLHLVRGEIRTNESIRYYFAFSQKRRKLIGNKNATR